MIKSALLRCIGFLFKLVKSKPLNTETSLNLIHKSRNDRLNCYKILLQNKSNKNVNDLLKDLFLYLKTDEIFSNMNMLVLATGYVNDIIFNLHPNLLITKTTTYDEYFNKSKSYL